MRRILSAAAVSAVSIAPMLTSAATLTTNLTATATIVAGCTAISQTTGLSFGTTLAPGAQPTAAGALSTTCASGVPAVITFATNSSVLTGAGTNPTTLAYGLFSDSAETTALTTGGITVTGSGAAHATPIYGKLTAAIPVDTNPGAYTDTVAVTLTF
jgi:spore coat protein U-like protein